MYHLFTQTMLISDVLFHHSSAPLLPIFVTETISRTDKGQPRPKYIFNKCGTNIYFFTLQRFGPSPSPNFKNTKPMLAPKNRKTLRKLVLLNCSVCAFGLNNLYLMTSISSPQLTPSEKRKFTTRKK